MRQRLTGLLTAATLVGGLTGIPAAAATPVAAAAGPVAVAAKSCSSGYVRAHVGGHVKCLRAGEYCAKRYHRAYHSHGFQCVRSHGVLRLKHTN